MPTPDPSRLGEIRSDWTLEEALGFLAPHDAAATA